jgi:hypothetical protein
LTQTSPKKFLRALRFTKYRDQGFPFPAFLFRIAQMRWSITTGALVVQVHDISTDMMKRSDP